ncbi:hypothetical protein [Kitasatospora indigofera]|uniref:non-homologous end-joining DNA ligase LigD n=1 Tax=Kitasatospora indigofera TaxID=67307 RepID=UPI0033A8D4CF
MKLLPPAAGQPTEEVAVTSQNVPAHCRRRPHVSRTGKPGGLQRQRRRSPTSAALERLDLDPPDDDFEAVRAAGLLRALLDEPDLPSLVEATGSRGLHDPDLSARRSTIGTTDQVPKDNPWRDAPRGRSIGPAERRLAALRGREQRR